MSAVTMSVATMSAPAMTTAHPTRRPSAMRLGAALAFAALAGCAAYPPAAPEAPPQAVACPAEVPQGARCLRGQDSAQSHYMIVVPAQWSGVLVVHAHGGPTLGTPTPARADEDLKRWVVTVREGHAWAASVFRQGGVAVRSAAEDSERVRRIFVEHVARPRVTLLHGQSWGAMVAAKAAEMYPRSWDGVLLTSGVLAGRASYDFRLDLRVVYQHLCGNHPAPGEPAYPLWMGLPADAKLTRAELASRVDACLGVRKPAAQRTPEQARKLATLVGVVRIPESSVIAHLNWATWHFQDIAQQRTGGRSAFGNEGVRYTGSADDRALNAAVLRYRADPQAVAQLEADLDASGRIRVPVLTTHGIGDATAFVELQDSFRRTMERAGNGARLVQTYVDSAEHSYLGDATYPPLFAALLDWVERGAKPTPAAIAQRCRTMDPARAEGCRFVPDHVPRPLASRVPAR